MFKTKPTLFVLFLLFVMASCQETAKEPNQEESAVSEAPSSQNQLSETEKAEGWQLLFDGQSADQWRGYGKDSIPGEGWMVEDGMLKVQKGGGDLITKEQYGNFELQLEFALTDTANSGIFYLAIEEPKDAIWKFAAQQRWPQCPPPVDSSRRLARWKPACFQGVRYDRQPPPNR